MKTTILLAAALTVTGGIWLRAQQSEPASPGTTSASEPTESAQCEAMCARKQSGQRSANLPGWDQERNLSDEQRARLRAIEDKAVADAKDVLTSEQQEKLKELANSQLLRSCLHSAKHAGPTAGEIGHGVSVGCSQAHGQAEGVHFPH
jgi:hypothetical protein